MINYGKYGNSCLKSRFKELIASAYQNFSYVTTLYERSIVNFYNLI